LESRCSDLVAGYVGCLESKRLDLTSEIVARSDKVSSSIFFRLILAVADEPKAFIESHSVNIGVDINKTTADNLR